MTLKLCKNCGHDEDAHITGVIKYGCIGSLACECEKFIAEEEIIGFDRAGNPSSFGKQKKGCGKKSKDKRYNYVCGENKVLCPSCSNQNPDANRKGRQLNTPEEENGCSSGTQTLSDKIFIGELYADDRYKLYVDDLKQSIKKLKEGLDFDIDGEHFEELKKRTDWLLLKIFGEKLT